MQKNTNDSNRRSKALLLGISVLNIFFIAGWPATQLFVGNAEGEGGLGLIIVAPFLWLVGFILSPIFFWIARSVLRLPILTFIRVVMTSLLSSLIGAGLFIVPAIMPAFLFNLRVNSFDIKPTLVSQNLDTLNNKYQFTLELDNKTNKTYENVNVHIATGFLHSFPSESFVWTANHASPHNLTLSPGVTTITDSINLADCSENYDFQKDPVRLSVELVFGADDQNRHDRYTKKRVILTPEIDGIDFAKYYVGMCNWFTND